MSRTAVEARLSLGAFQLTQAVPYVPSTVAALPAGGRLTLDLRAPMARPADRSLSIVVAGEVGLADLAVIRRGAAAPLLRVPKLAVTIKESLPFEGAVTLAAVEVDGLDLSAVRDRQGQIDLLALVKPPEAAAPATTPPGHRHRDEDHRRASRAHARPRRAARRGGRTGDDAPGR